MKEVLINSFKKQPVTTAAKPANVAQLESIANSLEASGLPFHPENPEGSMIKELLLKTRVINLTSATSPSNSSSPIRYQPIKVHLNWIWKITFRAQIEAPEVRLQCGLTLLK